MNGLAAFAWCWMLMGILSGILMGAFFQDDKWLGGYGSWERRMLRLGHTSFFGTGLLCFMLAVTRAAWPTVETDAVAYFLVAGSVTMPLACVVTAVHRPYSCLFTVPVLCLLGGVGLLTLMGTLSTSPDFGGPQIGSLP